MMIMIRDGNFKKFQNPITKPLIKFKIASDELRIVFNPTTYVHLVNISKCFNSQDAQSKDAEEN